MLIAFVESFKKDRDPKPYSYVALVPRAPVGTIPRVAVDLDGLAITNGELMAHAAKRLAEDGYTVLDVRTPRHLAEVVRTMDIGQVASLDAFLHGWAVHEFGDPGCLHLAWVDVKDLKSVR